VIASFILTEDENTLARMAAVLGDKRAIATSVFLLKDGFELKRAEEATQTEFGLPS
jgi:hypothetical protein